MTDRLVGEREERLSEGECEYVYQDQPASQEQGETSDCNCASRGLLHYGRHGLGCPYGKRASKIAAEQIRERQRELDTGLRAPEGWEGDPQPLEALASSPSPPDPDSSPFREPAVTSGYPLEPDEQAAVDRVADGQSDSEQGRVLREVLRRAFEEGWIGAGTLSELSFALFGPVRGDEE